MLLKPVGPAASNSQQSARPPATHSQRRASPEDLVPAVGCHRLHPQGQVEGSVSLRLGIAQLRQQQQQAVGDGRVDRHAVACGQVWQGAGGGSMLSGRPPGKAAPYLLFDCVVVS